MYAIVEIKGKQYKIEKGQEVFVDLLGVPEGDMVEITKVLLYRGEKDIIVGRPYADNVVVKGKVLKEEVKDRKIIVFKFRHKTNYRKKKGHRQKYTKLLIEDIIVGKGVDSKKAEEMKEMLESEG